jgi:hypothetical protein
MKEGSLGLENASFKMDPPEFFSVVQHQHKICFAGIQHKNPKNMLPKMSAKDSDVLSLSSQSNEGNSRCGSSKSSSMTDKTNAQASDTQSELAQQETKLVKRSKALVFLVLLAAAAGCGQGKSLLSLE